MNESYDFARLTDMVPIARDELNRLRDRAASDERTLAMPLDTVPIKVTRYAQLLKYEEERGKPPKGWDARALDKMEADLGKLQAYLGSRLFDEIVTGEKKPAKAPPAPWGAWDWNEMRRMR